MLDESLKKENNRVVGIKQTKRALEKGGVSYVYVARDADAGLLQPIVELCRIKGLEVKEVQTMSELGKICGIAVGAAVAAVQEK
ncbi:LSU ribosomal protein L7AE [Syntrophobotulus glycolicus DSM 8271]|uniref:LSU ribosomal protein L7AE n=1 Tax=Syntrophobotulus glycolicus (strain DSM 8271 / FlGlyR) TaxID=645991 RepID=F0SY02_SYNGF|nr:ribosomal L7Ae/L30e/S12e/Gadd45 family protein [Syntrophobotulus glycolicus]ADY54752.1 LSU ribosomal protein L7AE [Syntrophobotulus glycolicus DSM 8271]